MTGAHVLGYTPEAEAARAALRRLLPGRDIDAGDRWLILELPPAEPDVQPSDGSVRHTLSLICDDIAATVAELPAAGFEIRGEPEDRGCGICAELVLPGGLEVQLYEPRHVTAIGAAERG